MQHIKSWWDYQPALISLSEVTWDFEWTNAKFGSLGMVWFRVFLGVESDNQYAVFFSNQVSVT